MNESITSCTRLAPLSPEHLESAWELFAKNHERLDDIIVDLWVDEPALFFEHFLPIAQLLTTCRAYVILKEDVVIGFLDTGPGAHATRIGYLIDQAHEGQGIMKQHLSEALARLSYPVEARIHQDNTRSQALVERLGFVKTETIDTHYHLWRLI